MTTKTISIFRDGVWAGDGRINMHGEIVDCAAVLGPTQDDSDDTYEAIMDAIDNEPQDAEHYTGSGEVERPDGVYSWQIDEEDAGLGSQIQVDKSSVGRCWTNVAANDIPANIRQELEAEILDGGREHCDDYIASNGLHYRW